MPQEIITLHVGQCGVRSGEEYWSQLGQELDIDGDGTNNGMYDPSGCKLSVYYDEAENGKRFIPRAIFADLDPQSLDDVRGGTHGRCFRPDNFNYGRNGSGGCFANGRYTNGNEVSDRVLDSFRRALESCDCLQGIQVTHSISGGTGSGLLSTVLSRLREECPDRIVQTFTLYPSPKSSTTRLEPYNAVGAMHYLVENTDMTNVLDNDALFDVCSRRLGIVNPNLSDANFLMGSAITNTTASLRFPGQLNTSLRSMALNLVPFPRMHFFVSSIAPTQGPANKQYCQLTVPELTKQIFDAENMLCSADPRHGRYMTAFALFRGRVSTKEVDQQMLSVQNKNSSYFAEWIPNNVKSSICDFPARSGVGSDGRMNAMLIGSTSAVQEILKRLSESFTTMFKKKAHLHHFTQEGMDEMEFTEAESNLNDAISEYQSYQGATCGDDDGSFEDD